MLPLRREEKPGRKIGDLCRKEESREEGGGFPVGKEEALLISQKGKARLDYRKKREETGKNQIMVGGERQVRYQKTEEKKL